MNQDGMEIKKRYYKEFSRFSLINHRSFLFILFLYNYTEINIENCHHFSHKWLQIASNCDNLSKLLYDSCEL